jgi:Uma2 family endonuclease
MTTLPDWMSGSGEGLSAADYEALPDEVAGRVEVVDGRVLMNPGRRRTQRRVARRLANALEQAVSPGLAVDADLDVRLRDTPLVIRRPEVTVYAAPLPDEDALRPEHCLLVVEIMSRGSVTTDQIDKPAEYAASGIRHFWRVETDDRMVTAFRYQLDPMTRAYALVGLDKGTLSVTDPVPLELDLEQLR